MICDECKINLEFFPREYVDLAGMPKYYWNKVQTPINAEVIFCSPYCSNKWYNSKKVSDE